MESLTMRSLWQLDFHATKNVFFLVMIATGLPAGRQDYLWSSFAFPCEK